MSLFDNQEEIPELRIFVQRATYEPRAVLDECDALAGCVKEQPLVLELAKTIIALTVVLMDDLDQNRLAAIFERVISCVDAWDIDDKRWFSEKAAQTCANTHQICAKYFPEVPATLREFSAIIDQHTQPVRNFVLPFKTPSGVPNTQARPDYDARFGTEEVGSCRVLSIATRRMWLG